MFLSVVSKELSHFLLFYIVCIYLVTFGAWNWFSIRKHAFSCYPDTCYKGPCIAGQMLYTRIVLELYSLISTSLNLLFVLRCLQILFRSIDKIYVFWLNLLIYAPYSFYNRNFIHQALYYLKWMISPRII